MEIELKLALAPEQVARFRRHPALAGGKPSRRQLYSIYFDTPDFDLLKSRIALRLRRVGYHWIQTVKAEAGTTGTLSARPEWEVRVSGNRPDLDVLPEAARALFKEGWRQGLAPAFSTRFQRTAWHLVLPEGEVEVALDQGEIEAGTDRLPISEVELELKSGAPEVLFDLVEAFSDGLPFGLEVRSKALRGYVLCGALKARPAKAAPVALRAEMPAGLAWQAMIRAALGQFADNAAGCMAGEDPEYLHQLRVAVRRLRSTVSLARRMGVPDPAWAAELKWLMGEFGPARDWDVFHTETLPRLTHALGGQDGWPTLLEAVARRREAANRRARRALGSNRAVRLVLAIERDLLRDHPEAMPTGEWAAAVLDMRLRKLRRAGKGFERLDAAARHRVRIAAKRLRYGADAFQGLHGDRAAPYQTRLAKLQDALGAANDAVMAAHLLAELRADDPSLDWLAGLLEGYLRGEARAREREVSRVWRDLLDARPFWKPARRVRG